ncbi:hypothetical protein PQJ75_11035 [Rhodoplanes sp. TEM]|uniref:Uncharacterized protein n=1 Tax=Rhodoplanes tepidamans TaxID=200616 RepID=A0ABT5JBV6_RHOTP|nr:MULTISPECIES: hypothetical protein [Rhodoplanes]MDC7787170.1 hypothetical protein [Rhodoplanes tepidamans]MDC7984266.1 hypothetical protein [Rhodoplanes sp. TEM]MDQ0356063.1 hypothetical protein [Rhodoplanes tepidamans]
MVRSGFDPVLAGRIAAAAAALLLGLAAVSTPAEARKLRLPVWRSSATPAPRPVPVQSTPVRPHATVYVTSGTRPVAPTRASAAGEGDLARLAGPDVASAAASPALAGEKTHAEEKNAHRKAWLDFCQPKLSAPDRYGIERWVYAHEGCQFGRTE